MKYVGIVAFVTLISPSLEIAPGVGAAVLPSVIQVGEDRLVHADPVGRPLVEPHLSIDPDDPRRMVAGAMVANADGTYGVAGFTSQDGGVTWARHDFPVADGGDAWTAALPGNRMAFALAGDRSELQVFVSADAGRTWPARPVIVGASHDHPTLVVDRRSTGSGAGLYAVSASGGRGPSGKSRAALHVARSNDAGATFEPPTRVVASNLSYEAHNPVVLRDGTLLVPFADYRRPGTRRRLERSRDWVVASSDSGRTFSEPMLISESCNGAGGWSSLAAGVIPGATTERVYHVCTAQQFDGVLLRTSDTAGDLWSDEIRIDRPGGITPYTRTAAIAVTAQGVVGVAWYDGRDDRATIKGTLRCQEIYFAASQDGGRTFLPEVRVSSAKSCPSDPRNIATALRFPAGGEYMGLAAASDGTFHLLWADSRNGVYQLRSASAKVSAGIGSGR